MNREGTLMNERSRRVIDIVLHCFLGLICSLLAAPIAPAQSVGGRIAGTITDQTGAAIGNASISVTSEGTGAQRRATSDENGFFSVPELPVGFYSVKVEGAGFAPASRTRVKVDVGAETRTEIGPTGALARLKLPSGPVTVSSPVSTSTIVAAGISSEVVPSATKPCTVCAATAGGAATRAMSKAAAELRARARWEFI